MHRSLNVWHINTISINNQKTRIAGNNIGNVNGSKGVLDIGWYLSYPRETAGSKMKIPFTIGESNKSSSNPQIWEC